MSGMTEAEIAALPAKTKKHVEVIDFYRRHDFLTAYAMHTDWRVVHNGYKGAVGAVHDWERHGSLQFEFLKSRGLKPASTLLDIGCGTGRLARKVAPYLDHGGYCGVDLSASALQSAETVAREEGWWQRGPRFSTGWPDGQFDFLWAFSVAIHLPRDVLTDVLKRSAARMRPAGQFYLSYVPDARDVRTGFKQFRHTQSTYEAAFRDAGLRYRRIAEWTGEQRMALLTR